MPGKWTYAFCEVSLQSDKCWATLLEAFFHKNSWSGSYCCKEGAGALTGDLPLLKTTLLPDLHSFWEQRQAQGGWRWGKVSANQWLGQGAWGPGSPAVLGFRESAWPAGLTECMGWGGSKACLLFSFSVSASKYSNSVLKFYILVEWGHVPMNMFNVQNDFWDVCKPPTVLLPREGAPRAVGIYVKGATNAWAGPGLLLTLHLCLRSSHTLTESPGMAAQGLGKGPILPQQCVQFLCWCRQVGAARLQGFCVSKTGELCLKSKVYLSSTQE